jgi:predicted RNA-binding Zn ribbon-like protein
MPETTKHRPTAAEMRLDGGHPALDLVNTIYGQVDGPVEADVLTRPEDLVTFACRLGLAGPDTPTSQAALDDVRALRAALDAIVRARLEDVEPPAPARATLQAAAHAALTAATLASTCGALRWTWPSADARTPVHRLATVAVELLSDTAELARLRQCAGCRWLFLDHSRGAGRRWCSMADCGTEAKKRRYVRRRREQRTTAPGQASATRGAQEQVP